ncbi:Ubiquinone biosynthesis O-methyltransferase [Planctomycetes bacterium Pan216]|uniref:Ubiquinone biosynthesis O-methyltransferase n=1 Tax=Kolteria novifilia TaxID=2527975 RepID=A0A518B1U7_9BACT|nr:Ubiquinone biosynthesis O-methyltransferase [Planctomycetes bacterium Pan216]
MSLTEIFVCPATGEPLRERHDTSPRSLESTGGQHYPIVDGIARFVEDDDFADSFGFQWKRFEVRQPAEDEETFEVKTGVAPAALSGQRVLDAGCGGGRYSRIAAEHGAHVVAVDRSRAVEKTRELTAHLPNVTLAQADLLTLPLPKASFDLVFSVGVLHHSPDPRACFRAIAELVKPGGRLSVWVYRRNTWPQEVINDSLRWVAHRLPRSILLGFCRVGAFLGGIPGLNRVLNKVVSFSNHPDGEIRVCDTFDWYAPRYQFHYRPEEIKDWFLEAGFETIEELPPARDGRGYRWAWKQGLLPGSGVNVTGVRRRADG